MKVNIIEGPKTEENIQKVYGLIYKIVLDDIRKQEQKVVDDLYERSENGEM